MADHDHTSDYHRGEMDITEQTATFHMFNGLTKWGSLVVAVLVLMLVLWFSVKAGFLGGLMPGVVLLALGIFFLRDKPSDGH